MTVHKLMLRSTRYSMEMLWQKVCIVSNYSDLLLCLPSASKQWRITIQQSILTWKVLGPIVWTPTNSRVYSSRSIDWNQHKNHYMKPKWCSSSTQNLRGWFPHSNLPLIFNLSVISNNLSVKQQIINKEHNHLNSMPYTYPPYTKPWHLPAVSAVNLMLFPFGHIVGFVFIFTHNVIKDESDRIASTWFQ